MSCDGPLPLPDGRASPQAWRKASERAILADVKDGPALSLLRRLVAALWRVDLAIAHRLRRPRWELTGACAGCGACCVQPSIQVGVLTWWLPLLRRLFLAWQRHVNGLTLQSTERATRTIVFRCPHYDPATRRCDSHASRPAMCRE